MFRGGGRCLRTPGEGREQLRRLGDHLLELDVVLEQIEVFAVKRFLLFAERVGKNFQISGFFVLSGSVAVTFISRPIKCMWGKTDVSVMSTGNVTVNGTGGSLSTTGTLVLVAD